MDWTVSENQRYGRILVSDGFGTWIKRYRRTKGSLGIGPGRTWINSDTKTSTATCLIISSARLLSAACLVYSGGHVCSGGKQGVRTVVWTSLSLTITIRIGSNIHIQNHDIGFTFCRHIHTSTLTALPVRYIAHCEPCLKSVSSEHLKMGGWEYDSQHASLSGAYLQRFSPLLFSAKSE